MTEKEWQEWIEGVVHDGALTDAIEDEPRDPNDQSEWWVPGVPIDRYVTDSLAAAAHRVHRALRDAQLVSTASESISLDRTERLFPDLLLANPTSGTWVICEIKRSEKTEREAVTELLAYAHEVRNHLPFLASSDLGFVLISTEWGALLEHAVAAAVVGAGQSILPLRAELRDGVPTLHMHAIEAWRPYGDGYLPPKAIGTVHLCLYSEGDEADEPPPAVLSTALDMIAHDGERLGGHGFAFCYEDLWAPGLRGGRRGYGILVGTLEPRSFLPELVGQGLEAPDRTPVARFLSECDLGGSPHHLYEVSSRAKAYLSRYWHPMWEPGPDWGDERGPVTMGCQSQFLMRHRMVPLETVFWGMLGDHARSTVTHPAMKPVFAGALEHGIDWREPLLGLYLLDDATGMHPFRGGRFDCSGMFQFGLRLGTLGSLALRARAAAQADDPPRSLPASMWWAAAGLYAALVEVQQRYYSAAGLDEPFPPLPSGGIDSAEATVQWTEAMADWMSAHFLGKYHPMHRSFLQMGLAAHPFGDAYFGCAPQGVLDGARSKLADLVRHVLRGLLYLAAKCEPGSVQDARDALALCAGCTPNWGDPDAAASAADRVTDGDAVRLCFGDLPAVADALVPAIFHILAPLAGPPPASMVEALRRQVAELRAVGRGEPMVTVAANGAVGVALREEPGVRAHDPASEVVVALDVAGVLLYRRCAWEEVESGAAFDCGDG